MPQSADTPATLTVSNDTQKIVETILELGSQLSLPNVHRDWVIFDGTSGDCFKQWIDQVETIHLESKGNEEITLRAASRLLKGSALDYFLSVASQLTTWEQFKILMTEQYKHLTDSITARYQLARICQKSKETLPQYYERYKALASRAYIGVQHESCVKDTVIDYFIEGISEVYIKRYVRERNPKDLTHAYKLANDGQKVNVQMRNGRSKNEPEPMDCDTVAAQEAKEAKNAAQEVKEELSGIKDLLKVMMIRDKFQVEPQQAPPRPDHPYRQRLNEYQNSSAHGRHPAGRWNQSNQPQSQAGYPGTGHSRSPMQPPQKYRWTPDNKPICAYCGFAGHTQRVCRKKAAAYPSTNQQSGPQGPQQGPGRQPQNRQQQQQGNY